MRDTECYIIKLAISFPCLNDKLKDWDPVEFDPDVLYEMAAPWSTGEKLCVLFVLNVWNPRYAKAQGWHFDLFRFISMADADNAQALLNWLSNPYFP